ncbi:MAG: OmpA family protein [Sphingomonadales bacterium]|nr:OmpA family protein [Sphingomonadales bacterium]
MIAVFCLNACSQPTRNKSITTTNNIKIVKDTSKYEPPKAHWRNPVMTGMGADIGRVVRAYYITGDYNKMLKFVITPKCYRQKQMEYILRKSKWGYSIRMTNLQWLPDSTFVLTYITSKQNMAGTEQYVGRIIKDTAKLILFPEKENLFQYYGDEDLNNLCKIKSALDNIYFYVNSATLLPKSNAALNSIFNFLKNNPDLHAHFTGHASQEGNAQLNQQLSETRAKAICDYLIKMGIDKNRLSHEGKGDTMPLLPNTSEVNRSVNRRVEMIVR